MPTQAASSHSEPWGFPDWLDAKLLPDARFARAYAQFGDGERALLKRVIASHYLLTPPRQARTLECAATLPTALRSHSLERPVDYVLLLVDESLDAPALLLSALMPALTSGVAEVLVARLGSSSSIPASLLTACELAGQERVAALGPVQAERLVLECAAANATGLLLYAASDAVLRVLNRPALRLPLLAGNVRALPLAPPQNAGLWRDDPTQFPQEALGLLYGGLALEHGGCPCGAVTAAKPMDSDWQAFVRASRGLLLVPEARADIARGNQARGNQARGNQASADLASGAQIVVSEGQLGLWKWSRLTSELFTQANFAFTTAP